MAKELSRQGDKAREVPGTNPNDVLVRSFFVDILVSVRQTTHGEHICMELRNGLQTFSCDVQENRKGLRRVHQIAEALGLEVTIRADALERLTAYDPNV